MDWKEYQQKVAAFLAELGLDTQIDETVEGSRAKHAIDVTARMSIAGVGQLWIVECKLWNRRVPKERILAFRGVVEDVGADRGLLFSENGFQAGAISAARNTNITLTSLGQFEQDFPLEVASARARFIDLRIAKVMRAFDGLWDLPEVERDRAFTRYCGPPGFAELEHSRHAVVGTTARLSQMRTALEDAQFGRWPVAFYPLDHEDYEVIHVNGWDGLLIVVEHTLTTCERILAHMTGYEPQETVWTVFQPAELTALLEAIRASKSDVTKLSQASEQT